MSHARHAEMRSGLPEFPLFRFDLGELLAEVRAGIPGLPPGRIDVWVQRRATLASIEYTDAPGGIAICMHSVFNHPDTPREVIAYVLCHELLHLCIRPREVDGRLSSHPPEFWEAEARFAPNRSSAASWLTVVLGSCLRPDRKQECTFVKPNWKHRMTGQRMSLPEVATLLGTGTYLVKSMDHPLL